MKTILVIVLILFIGGIQSLGQGIEFLKGDYNAALEKAKQEGKMLFVDFYADWCGPCKRMAKDVFTLAVVGNYFNEKFVSVQINAEDPVNRVVVKQNKVRSYPTLAFFDADGKLLSRTEGALDCTAFIKLAKVVTGEEMSFEEIYAKFKSSKNDLVLMQQLLIGAPAYVGTLEDMERAKWIARIEKIFKDYIDLKMGPELINADDYRIINTFHHADKPGDKLMEFMNKNMEAYLKLGEGPAYFVMEYNNKIIENLARAGKEEYKKYLERIDGDMKLTYSVVPHKTMSARQRFTYLYDAEYLLFYKKDGEGYVKSMDVYFKELGEEARAIDYGMAAQQVYTATGGKVPENVILKMKEWTVKALQYTDISLMDKINFLAMLGDTNKVLKEYVEAKKYYNQAFMESMQMEQEMTKAMIQMKIKQKLAALDLIK
ncbi:MAG: thioredoxin family protein [Porphyromonadaceae bacterium]|nr:thioredoxin family protein [Butyricimonas sp.]MBS5626151.1 thioredoxin family protein [Porphyromonadaceae bacterium]